MKRHALAVAGILAVLLCLQASSGRQKGTFQVPRAGADFGRIPLQFIPNEGQVSGPVDFYVQGQDKTIYFATGGLTFVLSGSRKSAHERWVVKLDFVEANSDVRPVSLEESGTAISYFKGKPEDWKKGLPASSRIVYRDLWPGIDLVYYGTVDRLKYELIVHPGANPSRIKLAYRGAESVTLTDEGRLAIATHAGGFEDDIPVAWQEVGGIRKDVDLAYVLETPAEDTAVPPGEAARPGSRTRVFGFEVGTYNSRLPLVLDPTVLVYCGYIGGAGWEKGSGIAVDDRGNAYITGDTSSTEATFPVTVGPDLTFNGEPEDAFVAKVKADGTGLVYCSYIGGGGLEEGYGIAADASGNAYITGQTSSTDFPVTAGSSLTFGGSQDAFVAKVNADGTELVYSGCIGSSGDEEGHGIAVDGSGSAYVTGWTFAGSATSDFPVVVGPDLTYNGSQDVFVAKLNAAGTAFIYCGFIGGWANDMGKAIAVDGAGNAYVTGRAASDFPVKVGPDLTHNEWYDVFVAKVNAAGTDLVYAGYIGGWDDEEGEGIAVDGSGNAYVTGYTYSPNFPVVVGPDLTFNGGALDAFVAKVKADGSALVYCGYIGGDASDRGYGNDGGHAIAVDGSGNAYVVGQTDSSEATFPVTVGPDLTYNGLDDAFVAKVNAAGTALVYCGYFGGEYNDHGYAIAVDGSGNAYITGQTDSTEATLPVTVGPDLIFNGTGDYDAFVAKIPRNPVTSKPLLSSLTPSRASVGDPGFFLSVIGSAFASGSSVRWDGNDRPTAYVSASELQAEIATEDLMTGKFVQVTVGNPDGGLSAPLPFAVDNPMPGLVSLSTTHVMGGGAGFALTVQGTKFVPESVVRWNGSDRTTTYVSATELQAAITADDIATGGNVQVTVHNPAPAGGTSNAITLQVASFTLASTPLSATVTAGQSAAYTIQVTPQYGSFDAPVAFRCMGLPAKCTASFSTASATPGSAAVTTTLTISTQASSGSSGAASGSISGRVGSGWAALGLFVLFAGLLFMIAILKHVPWRVSRLWLTAYVLVGLIILIGGCSAGGGDDNSPPYTGTPKGTHQITVYGTSENMTVTIGVTLVVN
jgi:hypothetical protein